MHASFWTLYKRGRLAAHGIPGEQRERFGVACFALCLQHEESFRDALLAVCNVRIPEANWRVLVDPYSERTARWADILLEADTCAIVMECKVHDGLQPHQNPWKNERAFLAANQGYGWFFGREFSGKRRIYVALTESSIYEPKLLSETECLSLSWARIRELRTPGEWITDLFFWGSLDHTSFRSMKTANLHVDNIEPTLACMEVLTSVANRLALRDWHITHSAEDVTTTRESITNGYVGVIFAGLVKAIASST